MASRNPDPAESAPPTTTTSSSYIDYSAILSPTFSSHAFANTLVQQTNNPTDTPLDLATPLSRVLFDVQEVDQHIHDLTSKNALSLLTHAQAQTHAATRIVDDVAAQLDSVKQSYARLENDVLLRYDEAAEVHLAAERLWHAVRIGRAVNRILLLARQLELQMQELSGVGKGGREDHRALVRASHTLLALRTLFSPHGDQGAGGLQLQKVDMIRVVRSETIMPAEEKVKLKAGQIIREFAIAPVSSSSLTAATTTNATPAAAGTATVQTQQQQLPTYAQTEDARARTTSAINTLYLLSPVPPGSVEANFTPMLLLTALQGYLQTALTSSLASLSRALSNLPTLDRALHETSSRCQNIVALETLLSSLMPPDHPLLSSPLPSSSSDASRPSSGTSPTSARPPPSSSTIPGTESLDLLRPLLLYLDTSSLPSFFWRSLASSLSPRVQDIVNRGGASARALRANRDRIRDAIRGCVFRGCEGVGAARDRAQREEMEGRWDREAAVMVGSVVGLLGGR